MSHYIIKKLLSPKVREAAAETLYYEWRGFNKPWDELSERAKHKWRGRADAVLSRVAGEI